MGIQHRNPNSKRKSTGSRHLELIDPITNFQSNDKKGYRAVLKYTKYAVREGKKIVDDSPEAIERARISYEAEKKERRRSFLNHGKIKIKIKNI